MTLAILTQRLRTPFETFEEGFNKNRNNIIRQRKCAGRVSAVRF